MIKLPHIFHSWKLIDCLYGQHYTWVKGFECIKCGKRKCDFDSCFSEDPQSVRWGIDFINKSPGKNIVKLRVVK